MRLLLIWIPSKHFRNPLCAEDVGIDALGYLILLGHGYSLRNIFLLHLLLSRFRHGVVHILVQLFVLDVRVALLICLGAFRYLCLRRSSGMILRVDIVWTPENAKDDKWQICVRTVSQTL